jgi:hypothetical protein
MALKDNQGIHLKRRYAIDQHCLDRGEMFPTPRFLDPSARFAEG